MDEKNCGKLYIVATPIGNLEDITLRAILVLKEVDLIACEDTRVSGRLLKHFQIETRQISLHSHSKESKIQLIIKLLKSGKNIAYITDAGTPGVSDPGQALIQKINELKNQEINKTRDVVFCPESDIQILPIPGPSAVTATVSVSGLVDKEFYFAGFLPKKKGRRRKFDELKEINAPIVIFESAIRLEKTLKEIREYFGENAEIFVAREMTKMFEEYWGGKIGEVLLDLKSHKLKGEIVLIVKKSDMKLEIR